MSSIPSSPAAGRTYERSYPEALVKVGDPQDAWPTTGHQPKGFYVYSLQSRWKAATSSS
jgi:hypothetical protein